MKLEAERPGKKSLVTPEMKGKSREGEVRRTWNLRKEG